MVQLNLPQNSKVNKGKYFKDKTHLHIEDLVRMEFVVHVQ